MSGISDERRRLNKTTEMTANGQADILTDTVPHAARRAEFEAADSALLAISGANHKRCTIIPEIRGQHIYLISLSYFLSQRNTGANAFMRCP